MLKKEKTHTHLLKLQQAVKAETETTAMVYTASRCIFYMHKTVVYIRVLLLMK